MRRPLVAVAVLLLAAGACGGGEERTSSGSATPTPTTDGRSPGTATPEATGAPGRSPAAGGGPSGTTTGSPAAKVTPAPVKPAPAGTVNRPRTGQYVYDLSGSRNNPGTVQEEPYPDDSRLFVDLSAQGDVYTSRSRSNAEQTTTTTRTRWEPGRVLLTYLQITVPLLADFECDITPPVEIVHIPLKAETFPSQQFRNDDDQCSGTVDIQAVGREDVTDATGKSWTTWKVRNTTSYSFEGGFTGRADGFIWFSPDLGTAVRSDERNEGSFQGGDFTSHSVTVLRQHP